MDNDKEIVKIKNLEFPTKNEIFMEKMKTFQKNKKNYFTNYSKRKPINSFSETIFPERYKKKSISLTEMNTAEPNKNMIQRSK